MLGLACGTGHVLTAAVGLALTLLILVLGNRLEQRLAGRGPNDDVSLTDDDKPN
ncbi:hypothetical protein [Pseudomonas citronellolis]|nr:hypothetical protein [Pseudomonas citronellolis]